MMCGLAIGTTLHLVGLQERTSGKALLDGNGKGESFLVVLSIESLMTLMMQEHNQ